MRVPSAGRTVGFDGVALAGVGTLSLVLPLCYFIGVVGAWPQDDGIYFNLAHAIARDHAFARPFVEPSSVVIDGLTNPISVILARHSYNLTNAFVWLQSRDSAVTAAGFSLVSYTIANLAAYWTLVRVGSRREALIGTALLMVFPGRLIHATRMTPDMPMIACIEVAFLATMLAWRLPDRARRFAFVAGLSFGTAITLKEPALLMLVPLAAALALRGVRLLLPFAVAVLLALSVEASLYWAITGDPFFRAEVVRAAHAWKYFREYPIVSSDYLGGAFRVLSPVSYDTFYHLRYLFQSSGAAALQREYIGWFGVAAVPSAISVWASVRKNVVADHRVVLLMALLMGFALIEFGFTDLFVQTHAPFVTYARIFKEADSAKFVLYLALPISLVVAATLERSIRAGWRAGAALVCAGLVLSSLAGVSSARATLRSGMAQVRQAAEFLVPVVREHPGTLVYADSVAAGLLIYFSDGQLETVLRPLDPRLIQPRDRPGLDLVVEGGRRGIDMPDNPRAAESVTFNRALPAGASTIERLRVDPADGQGSPLVISELAFARR